MDEEQEQEKKGEEEQEEQEEEQTLSISTFKIPSPMIDGIYSWKVNED